MFTRVQLFATPWTVACQALLSLEFSRQGYWCGLPFPSSGDLPDPGMEPGSPALQADSLLFEPPEKPHLFLQLNSISLDGYTGIYAICARGDSLWPTAWCLTCSNKKNLPAPAGGALTQFSPQEQVACRALGSPNALTHTVVQPHWLSPSKQCLPSCLPPYCDHSMRHGCWNQSHRTWSCPGWMCWRHLATVSLTSPRELTTSIKTPPSPRLCLQTSICLVPQVALVTCSHNKAEEAKRWQFQRHWQACGPADKTTLQGGNPCESAAHITLLLGQKMSLDLDSKQIPDLSLRSNFDLNVDSVLTLDTDSTRNPAQTGPRSQSHSEPRLSPKPKIYPEHWLSLWPGRDRAQTVLLKQGHKGGLRCMCPGLCVSPASALDSVHAPRPLKPSL